MVNFLRKDGIDITKLKFGVVPCGTSDGLCTSIFDRRKEGKEFEVMGAMEKGVRSFFSNFDEMFERSFPFIFHWVTVSSNFSFLHPPHDST